MISKGLLPILFSILTILLAGCRSLDTSTADAQLDRGEYYDAQRNYRKVYNRLTKRNQRARRGEIARKLAICHTRLNQPARAALMLRNAIRYGQDDPQITLMLGQSLQREGKYAEAMKIYEEYTACHGLDAEATAGIEGCKLALGKKNGTRYRVSVQKRSICIAATILRPLQIGFRPHIFHIDQQPLVRKGTQRNYRNEKRRYMDVGPQRAGRSGYAPNLQKEI